MKAGSWEDWKPLAWAMVADPSENREPPPLPASMRDRRKTGDLNERLSYWGPFVDLLAYGLGWPATRPGLARWIILGMPAAHPVLRTVKAWYGPFLGDYLRSEAAAAIDDQLAELFRPTIPDAGGIVAEALRGPHGQPHFPQLWQGGWDPMHLSIHLNTPLGGPDNAQVYRTGEAERRVVLMLDAYPGWYAALTDHGPGRTGYGRSWNVDVVVKPVGWLGTFRQSQLTGRWFTGRHRWHQLGWGGDVPG
ncbi:hypothetical protein [Actinoplanes sp. RD1]|uniref:hypothetical protein n=1 Tax=Actinoplanes sp. RD1 TaxID=3064538 RepID=UPI002741CE2B|nr:hypothetical protein [Actinoplanes sp. RD1]